METLFRRLHQQHHGQFRCGWVLGVEMGLKSIHSLRPKPIFPLRLLVLRDGIAGTM
jgi:hypothetical protein